MINIEKIRSIRKTENFNLKPTPYLKHSYLDEKGIEIPVELRNYQKIGIYNMLMSPTFINGDPTGLGKTIQALSTIGYVWLKEPEYIPIVVTKKSALFQWEAETNKFMQNMRAITVIGQPFERDDIYAKFFNCRSPDDKTLLIMTYDNIVKDGNPTVVKDRSLKPPKELAKSLKEARKAEKEAQKRLNDQKGLFNNYMKTRSDAIRAHMVELLKPRDEGKEPKAPSTWSAHDQSIYDFIMDLRSNLRQAEKAKKKLDEEAAPSQVTPGIVGYMRDCLERNPDAKFMLIFDEVHCLKNRNGKIHGIAAVMAAMSRRRIGMTATPIKNRLEEFFSIFQIIEPHLFPKITHFYRDHCIVKMQKIGGGRQIPLVVGHSKEHLESFVAKIEPFYLARQKHEVAKELPELITRELKCELSDDQEELYDLAEAGLLNKAKEGNDDESSGAELLSALVLIQEACNAPQLIADEDGVPFEGKSSKIDVLLEMMEDELDGSKVIIFSRFERMISLIEKEFKKKSIKCVRITGAESKASVREQNKNLFQDPNSGINVILITEAGSESINLQAAEHIICVDSPWSWGNYVQLIGRGIRLGSKNKFVVATHLIAIRQNGKPTIDDHVIKTLRGKKKLSDRVAGVSLKDGLEFADTNVVSSLFQMLTEGQNVDIASLKKPAKVIRSTSKKKPVPVVAQTITSDFDFSDI